MTIDEAKILKAAIDDAIAKAEFAGSSHVDLQGSLSSQLGTALDELQAAIDAAKGG